MLSLYFFQKSKNILSGLFAKTALMTGIVFILGNVLFFDFINQSVQANEEPPAHQQAVTEESQNALKTDALFIRQQKVIDRFWLLLQKDPRQGAAFDRIYAWYAQSGRLKDLSAKCNQWHEEDPRNAKVFLLKGLIAQRTGDLASALSCYERASALAPNIAAPLIRRGMLLNQKGDLQNAVDAFEKALLCHPDQDECETTLIALARLYEQMGNTNQAKDALTRCETIFPDDPKIKWRIADFLRASGKNSEALNRFLHLANSLKNQSSREERQLRFRSVLAAGGLKIKLNQTDSAISDFRNLLYELDKESSLADSLRRQIEQIFLRAGRKNELISFYQAIFKEDPRQSKTAQRLTILLLQEDRFQEAEAILTEALSKAPSNISLQKTMLDLRLEERQFEDAGKLFQKIDQSASWNSREREEFLRARSPLAVYLKEEKASAQNTSDELPTKTIDQNISNHPTSDSPQETSCQSKSTVKINDDTETPTFVPKANLESLRQAVLANPSGEPERRRLLNKLDDIGRTSEAIEVLWSIFDSAFLLEKKTSLAEELFDLYRKINRVSDLKERLSQKTDVFDQQQSDQQRNNKICLALVYSLSGDTESAYRMLTTLFDENEGSRESDLYLATRLSRLATEQGHSDEAIRYQQIVCALTEDSREIEHLIRLYYSNGQKNRAQNLFLKLSARTGDPAGLLQTADLLLAAAEYDLALSILDLLEQLITQKPQNHFLSLPDKAEHKNQLELSRSNDSSVQTINSEWREILYRKAEALYWLNRKNEADEIFKKITSLSDNRHTFSIKARSAPAHRFRNSENAFESLTNRNINRWHLNRWNPLENDLLKNDDLSRTFRSVTHAVFDPVEFKTVIFTLLREKISISDYYRKQFDLSQNESASNFLFPRFPYYVPESLDKLRILSTLWRIKIILDRSLPSGPANRSGAFRYPRDQIRELRNEIPVDQQTDDSESRLLIDIFSPMLYFLISDQEKLFENDPEFSTSEITRRINRLTLTGIKKYERFTFENFLEEITRPNLLQRFDSFQKDQRLDLIIKKNSESEPKAQMLKKDLLDKAALLRKKEFSRANDKIAPHERISQEEMIRWCCHQMENFISLQRADSSENDAVKTNFTASSKITTSSKTAMSDQFPLDDKDLFYKGYFALTLSGHKAEADQFLEHFTKKFGIFAVNDPLIRNYAQQTKKGAADLLFDFTCLHPFELLTGNESDEMKKIRLKYLSEIHAEFTRLKNPDFLKKHDLSNNENLLDRLANAEFDLITIPVRRQLRNLQYLPSSESAIIEFDSTIFNNFQKDLLLLLHDYIPLKTALTSVIEKAPDSSQENVPLKISLFSPFFERSEASSAYELTRLLHEYSQPEKSRFLFHLMISMKDLDNLLQNSLSASISLSPRKNEKIQPFFTSLLQKILKQLENESQSSSFRPILNKINFLLETADLRENRNDLPVDKKKLFLRLKAERSLAPTSGEAVSQYHNAILAILLFFDGNYREALQCLDEISLTNAKDKQLLEFFALEISLCDPELLRDRLLNALTRLSCFDQNDLFALNNQRSNRQTSEGRPIDNDHFAPSERISISANSPRFSGLNHYSENELMKIRSGWQKLKRSREAEIIFDHLLVIARTPAVQYDLLKELQKRTAALKQTEIDFIQKIARWNWSFSFQPNDLRSRCRDLALTLLNQSGKLDLPISLLESRLNNRKDLPGRSDFFNAFELQAELADLYLKAGRKDNARELIRKMENETAKKSNHQFEFSDLCARANLTDSAQKWRRTALEKNPDLLIDQFEYFARQYEKEGNISDLTVLLRQLDQKKFQVLFPQIAHCLIRWMKKDSLRPQIINYWKELWNSNHLSSDEQQKIRRTLCRFGTVKTDPFFAPFLREFVLDSLKPSGSRSRIPPYISIHQIATWTYEGIETPALSLLYSTKDLKSLQELRRDVQKIITNYQNSPLAPEDLPRRTDAVLLGILLDLKIGNIKTALLDCARLERNPDAVFLLKDVEPILAVFLADLDDPECREKAARLLDKLLQSKKMQNHASFLIDRLNSLSIDQQTKDQQKIKGMGSKP